LRGKVEKAKTKLGWTPKVSFEQLVDMMVKADIERLSKKI
jgi:GDPmannose 4,6-dehydratase